MRQLTASPLNNTWETTHDNKARLDAYVQHAHAIANVADGGRVAAAARKVLRLVGGGAGKGPLPRQLVLSDFGRINQGRFAVANPPHNAPMFRRVSLVLACCVPVADGMVSTAVGGSWTPWATLTTRWTR